MLLARTWVTVEAAFLKRRTSSLRSEEPIEIVNRGGRDPYTLSETVDRTSWWSDEPLELIVSSFLLE